MKTIRVLLAAALLAIGVTGGVRFFAAEDKPAPEEIRTTLPFREGVNVLDYGAKGDGETDDRAAIQRALDAACRDTGKTPSEWAPRRVIFPAGRYLIKDTLKLGILHKNLALLGTGGGRPITRAHAATEIVWDGDEGSTMIDARGTLGLRFSDLLLNGAKKAGIVFRCNTERGHGAGEMYFERIHMRNADVGMDWGADLDMCAADNTFVDISISHMSICGFRSHQGQQLNFVFIRPEIGHTPVGFWFTRGGASSWLHPCFGWVDTAFRFHGAGINSGAFSIRGLWVENFGFTDQSKRMVFLDANGECNVSVSGLSLTCQRVWGPDGDRETPNFKLGPSAQVTVSGCMLSGKIAELTGRGELSPEMGRLATWIQFDNCRFRCASDPRTDIVSDDLSGYEFRNCHVVADDTVAKEYKIKESIMIPHLVKYPAQAKGQPGFSE